MFNSTFKIVYIIEFFVVFVVRQTYTARYRKTPIATKRTQPIDLGLLALIGLGMLTPLMYVFMDRLDFADYTLPEWIGWLGVMLFGVAIWLLWRSHADLGRNWTPTPGLRDEHTLITTGVYRSIRHPMYAAQLLWGVAQAMMLHNWIAGLSLIVSLVPQYLLRVGQEEEMMLEEFGQTYREYTERTDRIIPRLGGSSSRS
ncbi:MAG TPA: protein-S-isoprenylcysteine O-methyltransferase [Anaerolineales bacterium]|nr:protein-S-isoprenylcysteine O-methyltransferase [Anaerolineales bacterium]